MADEQRKNPEFFDQDSMMIYIDPKLMSSLNDIAERKQEDLNLTLHSYMQDISFTCLSPQVTA